MNSIDANVGNFDGTRMPRI